MQSDSENRAAEVDTQKILATMSPDIYQRFRQAIEIGRWPNGEKLTREQRQTCLRAVIIYEHAHLPEADRTGFMPETGCPTNNQQEQALNWQSDPTDK